MSVMETMGARLSNLGWAVLAWVLIVALIAGGVLIVASFAAMPELLPHASVAEPITQP